MSSDDALVLASGSPRRRELIALGGWRFEVRPARLDETPRPGEAPPDYVLRLAAEKARAAAAGVERGRLVVAADTTVAHRGEILGKPADEEEALAMLQRLRGRTHQVYTALAVLRAGDETLLTDLACTEVPMRQYSRAEMRAYVASGDPFDKAGGYAIQHDGFRPVSELAGCYANVVGLPLCHLARTLAKLGVRPAEGLPAACQQSLDYECPVFERVLRGEL